MAHNSTSEGSLDERLRVARKVVRHLQEERKKAGQAGQAWFYKVCSWGQGVLHASEGLLSRVSLRDHESPFSAAEKKDPTPLGMLGLGPASFCCEEICDSLERVVAFEKGVPDPGCRGITTCKEPLG